MPMAFTTFAQICSGQAVGDCFCAGLAATTHARRWKRPGSANSSIRSVSFHAVCVRRANGECSTSIDNSYTVWVGLWTSTYFNSSQQNFLGTNNPTFYGEFIPERGSNTAILLCQTSFARWCSNDRTDHRASESGNRLEFARDLDAQSLVFDTSNCSIGANIQATTGLKPDSGELWCSVHDEIQ